MSKTVFGYTLTKSEIQDVMCLDGMTCASIGIRRKKLNEEQYFAVVNSIFGFDRDVRAPFMAEVGRAISFIRQIPAGHRTKMRTDAIAKIDGAGRRKHWKTERKERRYHPPSAKKEVAREAYRKKHLVLATRDGKELFGNVKHHAPKEDREAFYKSWDWRTARMEVLKRHARRCMCCGSTPDDLTVDGKPVRLVVDHIKPISRYWHLRLVQSNLQILCDECNMGKGAWDETDHRSESERQIAQQLTYDIGIAS